MSDNLTAADRSKTMRAVRSKDSTPERLVRSELHRLGYRFRLHCRDLPGTPDIVLPRHRAVVFVHGCFWHHHRCKRGRRLPKSRPEYWIPKISRNVERDRRVRRQIRRAGWRVLVVWECQTRDREALADRLERFLSATANV